ncbi:TPA: MucBP domain-containing protein, partial [Streptococcus equi subsp. zooepidemicus]|nr:MucBP domain-containing protein [Streptococcus equi subsp. zooepidemicus]
MAKKEMKYYLRKSAFGLASVSAALLVGTASVSAQVVTRSMTDKARAEAYAKLDNLAAQYPGTDLASVRKAIAEKIEPSEIAEVVSEAQLKAAKDWEYGITKPLVNETNQVVYMFGSNQGRLLPEELLNAVKLPDIATVKKGDKIELPTYSNVRTATGEWRFAGWYNILSSEKEEKVSAGFVAPGGDVMLIGYWEFVPFNANVLVSYVDTEGNVLGETVAVSQGLPGEAYDTTSLRLDKIEKDGKVYKFKKLQEGSPSEIGTTLEGDLRVVYVYEEVKPEPKPEP